LIPIHEAHRKYLRFVWGGKLYEFTCLPFGLSSGPRIFTKIMKPVVSYLRSQGYINVIYLDDLLLLAKEYNACVDTVLKTKLVLEQLGFVINLKKSELRPTTQIKFLGFMFNSVNMTMSLPKQKIEKLLKLCSQLSRKGAITIQKFSEFIGNMVAACPAVPYGLLHTKIFERAKFKALLKFDSYKAKMAISDDVHRDIAWWENTIPTACTSLNAEEFKYEIFSDASKTGWGVYSPDGQTHGFWSVLEQFRSINYRELMAAYYGLRCYA